MKNRLFFIIISILIFLTFSSCVPSLVYSPSINLPPKPLEKDDLQILGGFGYLPETRPDRTPSKQAVGGDLTFRYGFTDNHSMQLKGWYDFSKNVIEKRWGISISSIIVFNDSSNFRFGIMPTLALLFANNSLEGGGGSFPLTLWIHNFYPVNLYTSIGPAIGLRDVTDTNNQWGWGIFFNAGCALLISKSITLNLEIAVIKQVNEDNGKKDYFFSPSLNIGYIF